MHEFGYNIICTHPHRHCYKWLSFTAKLQMLDNDGQHNGQNAYANKVHEIYHCNINQKKHKCIVGFGYFVYCLYIHLLFILLFYFREITLFAMSVKILSAGAKPYPKISYEKTCRLVGYVNHLQAHPG